MGTKLSGLLRGRRLPLVAIAALVVVVAGLAVFLLNGPLRAGTSGGTTQYGGGATQHCGAVHLVRGDTLVSNPDEAGRAVPCFAQAYAHCEPATLTVTRMEIDVFTTETFTLAQSGGSCAITDAWSNTVSMNIHKSGTEHCAGLTSQADAIVIRACGILGDRKVPEK